MGLYEHWPYVNFHELNMDWIIKLIKNWQAEYAEYEKEWNDLNEAFESLKAYVNNYFDDLDIQTEVNNKLEEMYLDGTLQTIIDQFVNLKIRLFPIAGANTGDCTAFILPSGKVGIVDSMDENDVDNLISLLTSKNKYHIDYILISHYHGDHVNGIISGKLDAFINQNTTAYIPQDVPASFSDLYQSMTNTKNALTARNVNIIQPTAELETVVIDPDVKLVFYNVDHSAYYESANFDYNNCSLCAKMLLYDKSVFFSGDIGTEAQNNLIGSIGNVNVFKAQHHGSDNFQNIAFLKELDPDICYVCASSVNAADWFLNRQFIVQMAKNGKSVYSTTNNGTFEIILSVTNAYTEAKAVGKYSLVTGIDMLLGSYDNYQQYPTTTLQDIVNVIPINTYFDMVINLDRFPMLLNGLNLETSPDSTAFHIYGAKFYNNYFTFNISDIITGVLFTIVVNNGLIDTNEIQTLRTIKIMEIAASISTSGLHDFNITGVRKILSASFIYNADFYHMVLTDHLNPVISIRDTERTISVLNYGAPGEERNLRIRVTYM